MLNVNGEAKITMLAKYPAAVKTILKFEKLNRQGEIVELSIPALFVRDCANDAQALNEGDVVAIVKAFLEAGSYLKDNYERRYSQIIVHKYHKL